MSKGTSSPKAVRNYRFRIYPNREQEQKLLAWLEACRWIYNTALAQRKEAWEKEKRSVSRIEQQVWLKQAKKTDERIREVHSQAVQEVLFRVDRAFAAFFRRVKNGETPGYPRFKGRGRYKSLTYTQFGKGKGASFQDGKAVRLEYYEGHDALSLVYDIRAKELEGKELPKWLESDPYAYDPAAFLEAMLGLPKEVSKPILDITHSG